ncbi:MAG: NAD-dependent epimerase/dehydratase family protein [Leptolyngbya sp. PLA3]|nr:MAG: NAD-dependent epimerase/dehydratase family protein [Cyanobacteria bacterium CYA]MCE7967375.1 NAD-dependent epimerase/dehydratase family protein [Leptolyngbya sp. PL-A3]
MNTHRILVTGAAGFIGSHLVEALLALGHDVVGVDNFDPFYERAVKERNLRDGREVADRLGARYRFLELDFCEPDSVADALRGVEGVIHLGAKAGVRPSIADPGGYVRANLVGTTVLLEEAHRAGCRRVLIASSSSVYGDQHKVPFSEDDRADEPISPYAATKRACELLGHAHHHLTGRPVGMLRFFTVYGPRQRPDLAISLFMRRIAAGQPIRLFGDGRSSRDYTYIDDIVQGVLAAYEKIDRFGFRVWNLGSDRPTALDDLVSTIAGVVGREPIIKRAPMQPGDVERTWADLSRARAELNYNPATHLRDGVASQWAWMSEPGGA